MAKYYSSTFGKISGKHGSAVAVTRKDGTTYIRIYAKSSNPRTEKQQAHRAKFALSSKALVPFNPIFKARIGVTNGISIARSHAFKNAIVGEYPNYSMDYEKLMFSFGPLEKLHNTSVTVNEGVATLNWDFEEMYNCNADDRVSIVIFNKDANRALNIDDVALRYDKQAKIDIHDSWADSDLYFWAYVMNGDKISDSVFVDKCVEEDMIDTPNEINDNKEDEISYQNDIKASSETSISSCVTGSCQGETKLANGYIATMIQGFIKALIYNLLGLLGHLENSYKIDEEMEYKNTLGRIPKYASSLKNTQCSIFEGLYGKYQKVNTSMLGLMISS